VMCRTIDSACQVVLVPRRARSRRVLNGETRRVPVGSAILSLSELTKRVRYD